MTVLFSRPAVTAYASWSARATCGCTTVREPGDRGRHCLRLQFGGETARMVDLLERGVGQPACQVRQAAAGLGWQELTRQHKHRYPQVGQGLGDLVERG